MSSVNSNLQSLISQSFLNKRESALQTSIERLSSGFRINSARDDASGLAISTRLDAQARAFDVIQRNANDAASYMQVADGALSNISENLLRMDELRAQANNAFLSASDRRLLDVEYQQLIEENDRVIATTQYNGRRIFAAGNEVLSTIFGANNIDFDLSATLSLDGRGTKGALQSIFNTAGIGSTEEVLNQTNTAVASFISGQTGVYNINVTQVARAFQYRDTVGAGPFGIDASVMNSNPAVAQYLSGAPGTYNVNVATLANNFVYQDNVGTGNPTQGIAAAGFAASNTNPAVATITAADDSNAAYTLNVTSVAQGQRNVINGVAATYGQNGGALTRSRNDFRIDFGNGDQVNFSLADGQFNTADYVSAFNAAAGGRVSASLVGGTLTYTQTGTGTNNSFVVTNRSRDGLGAVGSYAPSNIFETNAGNTTQAASNAVGSLNGQAFNSQTNTGITVNAAGDAGRTATFNVLSAGTTTFNQRQATQNRFNIAFGDGTPGFQLNLGSGPFTAAQFVAAFNSSAAGAKFTAAYDAGTGLITYTGLENGSIETLSITNASTQVDDGATLAYAPSDVYNLGAGQVTQAGTNFTGTVNGTAFNDLDGANITAAGLTFNASALGSTTIDVIQASVNQFDVDFGDGTGFTLNLGTGTFTAADFVTQFNAQAAGRYVANYDGANITYTSLQTGVVNSLSIANIGSPSNNAFSTGNATTLQAGLNATGDVNGAAFNQATNNFTSPAVNFAILSVGSTQIDYTAETLGEVDFRFRNIKTLAAARDEQDNLRVALDSINRLRGKIGGNLSRLDSIMEESRIRGLNYNIAMGRIIDADFALETAKFTRNQILQQGTQSILAFSNADNSRILDLIATGL